MPWSIWWLVVKIRFLWFRLKTSGFVLMGLISYQFLTCFLGHPKHSHSFSGQTSHSFIPFWYFIPDSYCIPRRKQPATTMKWLKQQPKTTNLMLGIWSWGRGEPEQLREQQGKGCVHSVHKRKHACKRSVILCFQPHPNYLWRQTWPDPPLFVLNYLRTGVTVPVSTDVTSWEPPSLDLILTPKRY